MANLGLGFASAGQWDIDPAVYGPGSAAQDLAELLLPLIDAERAKRREAERQAYLSDPARAEQKAAAFPSGGLLSMGNCVPGRDYFSVDTTHWYEMLEDPALLFEFGQAAGLSAGALAQAICDQLMPPNTMLFFWMGRALESVPIGTALTWREEAATAERAKALADQREAASAAGKKGADRRRAAERAQRDWWVAELSKARADGYLGGRPAFVESRWEAFRARFPAAQGDNGEEKRVSKQVIWRDWLNKM